MSSPRRLRFESCVILATFITFPWPVCLSHGTQLVNVALGKPTQQTDNLDAIGLSPKAVDGIQDSDYYTDHSCTATASTSNVFWIVDLLRSYPIKSINITNRNMRAKRLRNFYIYVSDTPFTGFSALGARKFPGRKCLWFEQALPENGPHSLSCGRELWGRYVYVWNTLARLTLCEFEVFVDSRVLRQVQGSYSVFLGRKSSKSPFYSRTLSDRVGSGFKQNSARRCIAVCLSVSNTTAGSVSDSGSGSASGSDTVSDSDSVSGSFVVSGSVSDSVIVSSSVSSSVSVSDSGSGSVSVSGRHATVVQMELATRRCECIEENGLEASWAVLDDGGWVLMKSWGNL